MNGKIKRKGSITEQDVSMLLPRYQATTILTLLHEVAQVGGAKIDWKAQVRKTSTGITSPREYQMLWRHLAYCDPLMENLEDGGEPLDCDSDLEFELEASPLVNGEASSEATAYVKVLMSSNSPGDIGATNRATLVAPLTINIPNVQAPHLSSDKCHSSRGLNITVPVSVQKQSLPTTSPVEGNSKPGPSSSRAPSKKKRKLRTKEEDGALITAVQKFGEGNWQNAEKEGFKNERSASQLSQVSPLPRWSVLRKQCGKPTSGSINDANSAALTEAQLSTRQAISMALDMPMIGSLSAICSGKANRVTGTGTGAGTGTGGMASSSAPSTSACPAGQVGPSETTAPLSQKAPIQSQQASHGGLQKAGSSAVNRSQTVQVKPTGTMKQITGPNTSIQKAAIAAGGRIATPSTAASLFKAAQSKNAVHIRPGVPLSMTPLAGAKSSVSGAVLRPSNISQIRAPPFTNTTIVLRSVPGPGSQQAASSGQPAPCLDPSQTVPRHHTEEQKMTPAGEVEGSAATAIQGHSSVPKGGKVATFQRRKVAANQNQVPVVNLDDSDDMDVVVEDSVSQNDEQQSVKTTDSDPHGQEEHANGTSGG